MRLAKRLGEQWLKEPESVKGHFRALALQDKIQHARDHPEYVYQPRKAHEKKRRMTRRKKEALAASNEMEHSHNAAESSSTAVAPASAPASDFGHNVFGNITIDLGDDVMSNEMLRNGLQDYNWTQRDFPGRLNQMINRTTPCAIYSERTEECQNLLNFLGPQVPAVPTHWNDPLDLGDGDLLAGMTESEKVELESGAVTNDEELFSQFFNF